MSRKSNQSALALKIKDKTQHAIEEKQFAYSVYALFILFVMAFLMTAEVERQNRQFLSTRKWNQKNITLLGNYMILPFENKHQARYAKLSDIPEQEYLVFLETHIDPINLLLTKLVFSPDNMKDKLRLGMINHFNEGRRQISSHSDMLCPSPTFEIQPYTHFNLDYLLKLAYQIGTQLPSSHLEVSHLLRLMIGFMQQAIDSKLKQDPSYLIKLVNAGKDNGTKAFHQMPFDKYDTPEDCTDIIDCTILKLVEETSFCLQAKTSLFFHPSSCLRDGEVSDPRYRKCLDFTYSARFDNKWLLTALESVESDSLELGNPMPKRCVPYHR